MKIILVQNPNDQEKVKSFTESKMKDAVNYASDIYAKNFLNESGVDIKHLASYFKKDFYSINEIKQIISNFILHPYPVSFYNKVGNSFVWIYVVDLSKKVFWD